MLAIDAPTPSDRGHSAGVPRIASIPEHKTADKGQRSTRAAREPQVQEDSKIRELKQKRFAQGNTNSGTRVDEIQSILEGLEVQALTKGEAVVRSWGQIGIHVTRKGVL